MSVASLLHIISKKAPLVGVSIGSTALASYHLTSNNEDKSLFGNKSSMVHCDASSNNIKNEATKLLEEQRAANLRKRMTSIGKFSLKSQTDQNPSQPVFFLALSNHQIKPTKPGDEKDENVDYDEFGRKFPFMTAKEFTRTWIQRDIPKLHPRFHWKVSNCSNYFEPIQEKDELKEDLANHVSEALHMRVYRQELKSRVEQLLTSVLDVTDKLWSVEISSGEVGSSGAISKKRAKEIVKEVNESSDGNIYRGSTKETVLLFRCHHCLGDAVSITTALGDLLDEAQEIKEMIKREIRKRKEKMKKGGFLKKLLRKLQMLIWFIFGSIQALCRQSFLVLTTRKNPFLAVLNLSPAEEKKLLASHAGTRSISWCEVAPLDEAKRISKELGGPKSTVNDIFVSCVSKAIAKQLEFNRKARGSDNSSKLQENINVCIPAHLAGGVLPPGRGVGNLIGAFVARVPGSMDNSIAPSERLKKVHSSLDTVKRSPASLLSYMMAKFCSNYLPESMATKIFLSSSANAAVAISNSRGYEEKVHINGRTVESLAGFYPLPPGLPVGVLVSSYCNVVSLSVTAETWAVPDADQFLVWVLDEYKLLCKEAELKSK